MGCSCCKMRKQKLISADETSPDYLKCLIDANLKLCIWIMGGPGSGKGTQCELLAKRYNLVQISTGELLRKRVDTLGAEVVQTMEKGGLANNEVVLNLLKEAMLKEVKNYNGFLIDGYPRNVEQGELFCDKIGTPQLMIYLDCPDALLVERLLKRGQVSGRVDDNADTIRNRIETFHSATQPVVDYWKDSIVQIDGTMPTQQVGDKCIHAVEDVKTRLHLNFLPR